MILRRINAGAIMLVLFGLVAAGWRADEISLFATSRPAAARSLSFPFGQCMGNLYLEPESGWDWNLEAVRPEAEGQYLGAAQGDVLVPGGRNVKLFVRLALSPRESAKFLAQNPQAYQLTITDRTRKDPDDLSGLSQLDPNDLSWLSVGTEMYLRAGAEPRIFEPIRRLTDLQILSLQSSGITDEGLEYLRPLRSLRGLELTQAGITQRGLAVLKDLPNLEYLQLNSGLTDAGLKQVAQVSNLRWLSIIDGKMWGPGLAELAKLPRLERLCILHSRARLLDRHIKCLEGLTQLKSLTLWANGCDTLTDASLASIGKLRNLEELYFIRTMPKFTSAGVTHLKDLKKLRKVNFAQAWLNTTGELSGDLIAGQLAANHPNLESIKRISFLSTEGIKTLATLRNLKCLHVTLKDQKQDYYGPTGISHLSGLSSMKELHISTGNSLSDADLASLEPLVRMRDLFIRSTSVTDRGFASIAKLEKLENLTVSSFSVLGGTGISKSGLNQLNALPNLRFLQVHAWGNPAQTDPADELILDLSGLKKMKDMYLSGLPLRDGDLAFAKHLTLLENLNVSSDPNSTLRGAVFRHLRELPELTRLSVHGLSDCTGQDLAHLNRLPKLRTMYLSGMITDAALASLTGPVSLESIYIDTDEPISKQTTDDFTKSHPLLEYIHISELPKFQARPNAAPKPARVNQPRINRRTQQSRRRR